MMRLSRMLLFLCLSTAATSAFAKIDLTLSPAQLDFGSVVVGNSSSLNATIGISFDGQGDLGGNANNGTITAVNIVNAVGGDFTASQNCLGTAFSASAPDANCIVQVDCTPAAEGPLSANLAVRLDRLNETFDTENIPLNCTGVVEPVPNDIPSVSLLGLGGLSLLLAGSGLARIRRRKK